MLTFGIDSSSYVGETLGVLSNDSKVDFSVRGQLGSYSTALVPMYQGHPLPLVRVNVFDGQTGDWSSVQTISIPDGSVSSSSSSPPPNPTPSPTPSTTVNPALSPSYPTTSPAVPEFSLFAIVPLLLSMFSAAVLFRHRKTSNARCLVPKMVKNGYKSGFAY